MTILECDDNNLLSLNLDSNIAITTLYIGNNSNLSSLGSLGLTLMPSLVVVNLINNSFSSLDVTQNSLLEDLRYDSNDFTTSVDVTQNSALIQLGCGGNQLTEINVTQNTNLEILGCYDNLIEEINTTNNVKLERLSTYSNPLTTDLDVSTNVSLIHLWCYANQLTALDITQNPALIRLAFGSDPSLTSVDLRNGNNTNIPSTDFNSGNTSNVSCIFVDDAAWSIANWPAISTASTFVNNQAECDVLGNEDFNQIEFAAYPNPVSEILTIISPFTVDKLEVYNLLGRKILESNQTSYLNVSTWSSGVYLLNVYAGNKKGMRKIIVK